MSSYHLPAGVLTFAESYLSSADELVVLIALIESSSRWWDAKMISREVGITPTSASHILDLFVARNLLDIRVTGQVRYQFRPASPDVKRAALEFAEEFRRDPGAITAYLTTPRRTA